ncbi:MAG TPA: farnesyl diphosphate synthase [Arenimonas sp.]|uniref:polyprenyl synthetase family protein n=1 Tax=Arenimonas sp. TaxID=1872635 RepID=UPI002C54E253|nr:farnesyl diphosphate synthase [Arenimonas sp.]HMB55833.1 farnesyl diphosphate synthase [Arenimonas sp.]
MSVDALSVAWAARVEAALERSLPAETEIPARLHAAMRHAVLGGGKRIRPRLVHASGYLLGADTDALDAAAVAIELIHAYSLVHDDLPAMDDDDLRRGRPTVHVAFDEATAILVGDALQALAFRVLAATPVPAAVRIDLVATLAEAAGSRGMCGGQQLDMDATGQSLAMAGLERLHALKTGALIRASVRLGALIGGADAGLLTRLDAFAADLGLAFQIRDDILDVEADAAQLGKTAGKDAAQEKSTYPALIGLDGSKKLLLALAEKMKAALGPLDVRADALRAVAEFAVARAS